MTHTNTKNCMSLFLYICVVYVIYLIIQLYMLLQLSNGAFVKDSSSKGGALLHWKNGLDRDNWLPVDCLCLYDLLVQLKFWFTFVISPCWILSENHSFKIQCKGLVVFVSFFFFFLCNLLNVFLKLLNSSTVLYIKF